MNPNQEKMYGQWIGISKNTRGIDVRMMLNIEKRNPGIGQVLSHAQDFPDVRNCATFNIPDFQDEVTIQGADVRFFDVKSGALIPMEEYFKTKNVNAPIPRSVTYKFSKTGKVLAGNSKTDTGEEGTFELKNSINEPARPAEQTLNWNQFKEYISINHANNPSIIYRGQPDNQQKLRTSFHRCDRNNLLMYLNNDIPNLRHAVNAVSSFYYRDNDAEHLGALLSLAQHHGYPTPLLDWTYSPYIAAYFAFSGLTKTEENQEAARIFVFNTQQWPTEPMPKIIYDPLPSLTFHKFPAHQNSRFTPQQSVASFSNVDDMEEFINEREVTNSKSFITRIDIPKTEKRIVLNELSLMGITAGSLFPGLDGVCRSLKYQHFQRD